jgi:hypothetical protein
VSENERERERSIRLRFVGTRVPVVWRGMRRTDEKRLRNRLSLGPGSVFREGSVVLSSGRLAGRQACSEGGRERARA